MSPIYFDTSALVKRYCLEKGTRTVRSLLARGDIVLTSIISYPELKAAFARKRRSGEIGAISYQKGIRSFQQDWETPIFSTLGLTFEIASLAGDLVERQPLKALDAVHLASALVVRENLGLSLHFVSTDAQLNEAAALEGLEVIDPEKSESY